MPPHRGHQFLIETARSRVDHLTVILFTKAHEPIPGDLRAGWMRKLFPDLEILHSRDEHPVDFDDPLVWDLWIPSIRKVYPQGPELVFSSEDYGEELARRLGASHQSVDRDRRTVPVCAELIRQRPLDHWELLPPCVRPYYVKRVCLIGAESTGKTTLAAALAAHFDTVWVPEFARDYLQNHGGVCTWEDMVTIARGQAGAEETLAEQANRVLFCDTELLTTSLWSERYFCSCPEQVRNMGLQHRYDLYLLCSPDMPWMADGLRDSPHQRQWFHERFLQEMKQRRLPYVIVSGSAEQRMAEAVAAARRVLSQAP